MKVPIGSTYVQNTVRMSTPNIATPDPPPFCLLLDQRGKLPAVGGYVTCLHFLAPLLESFQRAVLCCNGPSWCRGQEWGWCSGLMPLKFSGLDIPQGHWKVSW